MWRFSLKSFYGRNAAHPPEDLLPFFAVLGLPPNLTHKKNFYMFYGISLASGGGLGGYRPVSVGTNESRYPGWASLTVVRRVRNKSQQNCEPKRVGVCVRHRVDVLWTSMV